MPSKTIHVDIAIIGTGSAGMRAYTQAKEKTDSIALIEGNVYGTTCARVGCMPSKLMIAPAEARHRVGTFAKFGLEQPPIAVDGKAVMKRVRDERDRFVGFIERRVESWKPEHRFKAWASFVDDHTLELSTGEHIIAKTIVIATGSTPREPEPLKAAGKRLITSDDIFYWDDLPESIAVIGAGIIATEIGQALHRLGVRVKTFNRSDRILGIDDPELLDYVKDTFCAEHPHELAYTLDEMKELDDGVEMTYTTKSGEQKTETFEYILNAAGRIPNVAKLNLNNTSLTLNKDGSPISNATTMQCDGAAHIFIAGDTSASPQLLHIAGQEGLLAGKNALRYLDDPTSLCEKEPQIVLATAFCDPQYSLVGTSYGELKEASTPFVIGQADLDDQGRARVFQVNRGLIRLYGEPQTGRLLGAELFGPEMEHIAHLLAWSMSLANDRSPERGLTAEDALALPFYHPTIEEALQNALRDLNSKRLSSL
jgi:dihydrolipoamide dehydrogenase